MNKMTRIIVLSTNVSRFLRLTPSNQILLKRRFTSYSSSSSSSFSTSNTTPSSDELLIDHSANGIITLSLNRHSARNALSSSLLSSLSSHLETISKLSPNEARCLILQSKVPKVFCSGADLKERAQLGSSLEAVKKAVSGIREAFTRVEKLSIPTIAAIEGAAVGGGLELALACDLIIAGKGATFGLPETSLAIIPGAGGTIRLTRRIGIAASKYLIYTAKKISADEALRIGLLTEMVEEGQAYTSALRIANSIALNGPIAIRAAKTSITNGAKLLDMDQALKAEEEAYDMVLPTQDRLEGLAAWKEKRSPNFKGN
jgi:methylglutaconyl-CoA hydratase